VVAPPQIREIQRLANFFITLSGFLGTRPGRMARHFIDPLNGSHDAVRCKKVPFDGRVDIARHSGGEMTQKPLKFGLQRGLSSQIENIP
jgi:hypothetical protein